MDERTQQILQAAAENDRVSDYSIIWYLVTLPDVIEDLQGKLARTDIFAAKTIISELIADADTLKDASGPDSDLLDNFAGELLDVLENGAIAKPEMLDQFVVRCRRLAAHLAGGILDAT